mgnify:CR=1 FL=1
MDKTDYSKDPLLKCLETIEFRQHTEIKRLYLKLRKELVEKEQEIKELKRELKRHKTWLKSKTKL